MRVDLALLCDAATVREGLLHILGGGITRLGRPEFPAELAAVFVLRVGIAEEPRPERHLVEAVVIGPGELLLARHASEFTIEPASDYVPGEELMMPLVHDFRRVSLPEPGAHSIEVLLDGRHAWSLTFLVRHAPAASDRSRPGRQRKDVSIEPHRAGWAIRRSGNRRVSKVFATKAAAEAAARELAVRDRVSHVVSDVVD